MKNPQPPQNTHAKSGFAITFSNNTLTIKTPICDTIIEGLDARKIAKECTPMLCSVIFTCIFAYTLGLGWRLIPTITFPMVIYCYIAFVKPVLTYLTYEREHIHVKDTAIKEKSQPKEEHNQ